MLILGIESSCDDTCLAVIDGDGSVVREDVVSQANLHSQFGGIVPEFASRAHVLRLQEMLPSYGDLLIPRENTNSALSGDKLGLVCVTAGPGLLGSLFAGFTFAVGLAHALCVPIMRVNHLEGHLLSPFIEHREKLCFPFLSLIISGGHCQFILARSLGDYSVIGRTVDDAPGEVFDKVGRLLGIDYPAGAMIDALAQKGEPVFDLPLPMLDSKKYGLNMSFSGLKTSVLLLVKKLHEEGVDVMSQGVRENICASFQLAVSRVFHKKLVAAVELCLGNDMSIRQICVCGGVGANSGIRGVVLKVASEFGLEGIFPSQKYCTDNAAMIANVGLMRCNAFGLSSANYIFDPGSLSEGGLGDVVARWPLESMVGR